MLRADDGGAWLISKDQVVADTDRQVGLDTEAERRTRCQPPEQGAHGGTDEYVARVVHACVHARERHDRGCGPQGQSKRRQQVPDGNSERGRGGGVARRKRGRRRHPHSPLLGDPQIIPVGTGACAGDLQGLVDNQGRSADSHESGERTTSPGSPSEEREEPGNEEPWLGVVRDIGDAPQRLVQQRRGEPRHRSVGGTVIAA